MTNFPVWYQIFGYIIPPKLDIGCWISIIYIAQLRDWRSVIGKAAMNNDIVSHGLQFHTQGFTIFENGKS